MPGNEQLQISPPPNLGTYLSAPNMVDQKDDVYMFNLAGSSSAAGWGSSKATGLRAAHL